MTHRYKTMSWLFAINSIDQKCYFCAIFLFLFQYSLLLFTNPREGGRSEELGNIVGAASVTVTGKGWGDVGEGGNYVIQAWGREKRVKK